MRVYIIELCIILICMSCSHKQQLSETCTVDDKLVISGKHMYEHLLAMSGKATMFGHQDAGVYGHGWMYITGKSDIKDVCGAAPAVYGWELGHLELGDSISLDSIFFNKIREGIQYVYSKGGINTISWHLRNPWNNESAWNRNVGTVHAILTDDEVGAKYRSWLDELADFMLSLRNSNNELIPVLFRPFHEHTGSWFWWGHDNCTAEDYKSLWRYTVSYLRDEKQVHNLLYIYSPDRVNSLEEYLDRYPGDEWVDIWGLDLYHRDGSEKADEYISLVRNTLAFMKTECGTRHKPFVFSETGLCELTMEDWFTNVLYKAITPMYPAYVLVWRNAYNMPQHYYAPYPGHPTCSDFTKFKNQSDILFLDEITNVYR